jgi:hypothetical protein
LVKNTVPASLSRSCVDKLSMNGLAFRVHEILHLLLLRVGADSVEGGKGSDRCFRRGNGGHGRAA